MPVCLCSFGELSDDGDGDNHRVGCDTRQSMNQTGAPPPAQAVKWRLG